MLQVRRKSSPSLDVGFHLHFGLVHLQMNNPMALERSARPLARCMRCTRHDRIISRSISSSPWRAQEETTTTETSSAPPPPPPQPAETKSSPVEKRPNPELVSNPRRERRMIRDHSTYPIGSRRRRAALASSANIPFEQLPYQCLQEARKVIQADRADKVAEIEELRGKIMKWTATEVPPERERIKELRLQSWTREIERLKILADSNDPLVKKKFEDGVGERGHSSSENDMRMLTGDHRRHEQAHLPPPRRPQMALARTRNPRATHHPDERRS